MLETKLFCEGLKFAAHAAAKKDLRFYLLGVRIEWEGNSLHMVGTDGSRCAVLRLLAEEAPAPCAVVIGNDDIKRVLSAFGKDKGTIQLLVEPGDKVDTPPRWVLTAGGTSLTGVGLKGTYPNWRRFAPPKTLDAGTVPHLDANYLAQACAAIAPFARGYKGTRVVQLTPGKSVADVVVVAPGAIADYRVHDCQVVIAPVRQQ